MKPRRVWIDSFNFSSERLEDLLYSDNYIVETVKSIGIFEPKIWSKTFGKPLTRNIIEAKILHTPIGLTIPIKRFSVSQDRQTLELAGLYSYTDISKQLRKLLKELWEQIQDMYISRLDVAIDFKGAIPKSVIKALEKRRYPFEYMHTTYLKTAKEKKTNTKINILIYPKHIKENLDYEIGRLEFVFRGGYFSKLLVKDIDTAYKKMEKSIKRLSGLEVKIQPL